MFRTCYNGKDTDHRNIQETIQNKLNYGDEVKIALIKEKSYLTKFTKKQADNIVIVSVQIQDENGELCTQDDRFVSYNAEGAEILGVASGNLTTEAIYSEPNKEVYRGRALVILKKLQDNAKLTASSDKMSDTVISL